LTDSDYLAVEKDVRYSNSRSEGRKYVKQNTNKETENNFKNKYSK